MQEEYKKEWEEKTREKTKAGREAEQLTRQRQELSRKEQDQKEASYQWNHQLRQKEKQLQSFEKELDYRKKVISYLGLEEATIFDTEQIISMLQAKIGEVTTKQKILEKEENDLRDDYKKLKEGILLELPKKWKEQLEQLGIAMVYGMEWLRKNGLSEEKNKQLVASYPFLPYALLLSKKELDLLQKVGLDITTSIPIPIVVREDLGQVQGLRSKEIPGHVVKYPDVHFYLLFDQTLLDEKAVENTLAEILQKIQRKKETIAVRERENLEFHEKLIILKNQMVTKECYEASKKEKIECESQQKQCQKNLIEIATALAKLSDQEKALQLRQRILEKELGKLEQRQEAFADLKEAYVIYAENCKQLEACRQKIQDLQERQKIASTMVEHLSEKRETLRNEQYQLERQIEATREKCDKFQKYASKTQRMLPASMQAEGDDGNTAEKSLKERKKQEKEQIAKMEARYDAITSSMSFEIQDLEEQEQKFIGRYEASHTELMRIQEKYSLMKKECEKAIYDAKEEKHQEQLLKTLTSKYMLKQEACNKAQIAVSLEEQKLQTAKARMQEECGQEVALPKEVIVNLQFDERIQTLLYQKRQLEKKIKDLQKRQGIYNELITSSAQFEQKTLTKEISFELSFEEQTSEELRTFLRMEIRNYNQCNRNRQHAKEELTKLLNALLQRKEFQDEYKKPLEAMLSLTDTPQLVKKQLDTTIQSYDDLMDKLAIDLSMIERERERLTELLQEYLHDVHSHLNKIDSHSTITVRGRALKMLQIGTPSWDANEQLYRMKINDFMEELTQKGIEKLEKNQNAEEYYGLQVTTKQMYDKVVGISNVQIRLYKIEAQKEYPISWTQVAKNSGGEGFLSAFVILSSLLYYMRKDDSDIFADRNEGKVLIMDNPFAQTNASHLLIPLMDMAKKTNTQLICLTGLGGDSIYNRFDNIYVLNLIEAGLKNSTYYLKGEHLRGGRPDEMVSSQIQVYEQMTLF